MDTRLAVYDPRSVPARGKEVGYWLEAVADELEVEVYLVEVG